MRTCPTSTASPRPSSAPSGTCSSTSREWPRRRWSARRPRQQPVRGPVRHLPGVLFFNLQGVATKALVSSATSTDTNVLAKLTDDPNTAGTQYTLLQVPLGNAAFVDNGVKAGDIVRFLFTTD